MRRKNQALMPWLQSLGFALVVFLALTGLDVEPALVPIVAAAIVAGLAFISTELGTLAAIVAIAIPVFAADPIVGLFFIVLGLATTRYLGAEGGRSFLIVALSVAGALLGPLWAGVLVAGYLLGSVQGAVIAGLSCLLLEFLGFGQGLESIGPLLTGGPVEPLLQFDGLAGGLFSSQWATESVRAVNAESVNDAYSTLGGVSHPIALVLQPLLWAGTAALVATLGGTARRRLGPLYALLALVAGVLVLAVGTALIHTLADVPLSLGDLAVPSLSSLAIALLIAAIWELVFPFEEVPVLVEASSAPSMAAEDADVDELLRLIATAEEQLSTKHTTEATVMITDMKSFSKMTEEEGSVHTAKAIQRHRDLLLPVVEREGGHGKSTGGDGLVASFEKPRAAIDSAVEMQAVLARFNTEHPNERPLSVRIGIAQGEVVLDKGGRPFIGHALNMAARIMNLADGGQIYVTRDLSDDAGRRAFHTHSHGGFELKNIAEPVEVIEVLWVEGQQPVPPQKS
jgi:class 3 adenylate cyclase